jgi:gliding motility-associated-like protein
VIEWEKNYGGSGPDWAYEVELADDGGYVVVGSTISDDFDVTENHGFYDYWILKIDASGMIEWTKHYGGAGEDRSYDIHKTNDGGYIVGGSTYSTNLDVSNNFGGSDYWILKLDGNGDLLWENNYGGSGSDWVWSIDLTDDNGFVICGRSNSTDGMVNDSKGNRDFWVVKINAAGEVEWTKSFGGTSAEVAYAVHQTDDEGYIIAGYSESDDVDVIDNYGDWDYWVVKISPRELFVDLGDDTSLCTGETLQLSDPKPGASYLWQDGSTDRRLIAQDTGTYWVVVDVNGCATVDTIYIGKCERFRDPCFEIPNVFSNNGDGLNDYFKPVNFCPLDSYQLKIFNRWGQIIFETNDPETSWDGFYKGKRIQHGVYAYLIEYRYTSEGESIIKNQKGTVLMLR